jgi:NarL family two-component system sensor histidine kinase LiaS
MRHMAERIQALLQTRQELAALEERNRLARELHDTVKQHTFATLMQVRAARNLLYSAGTETGVQSAAGTPEDSASTAIERLVEAESLLKSTQQELGLLIAELRPAELEGKGLSAALQDYLTTWSQHACIPTDFQVKNGRGLPLEVEQAFFRVAQEALSNVVRHSRASAVSVRLDCAPEAACLEVADNGAGFDPARDNGGFGLHSMQERMQGVGGSLGIETSPGNGVVIRAVVPVRKETA